MSAIFQRDTLAMVNAIIRQEVIFACALLATRAMLLSQMDAKVQYDSISDCNPNNHFVPNYWPPVTLTKFRGTK